MVDEMVKRLRATRSDYEQEGAWHKFLLDAAHGTGGFSSRVCPPETSVLGWAAEAYARFSSIGPSHHLRASGESYLDQFAREDAEKFAHRVKVASYRNYVGPIGSLIVGYVNKQEFARANAPDELLAWMQDCDGNGTPWDTLMSDIVRPCAAQVGYCPLLFYFEDRAEMAAENEQLSAAARREMGLYPCAMQLYPANLLDWRTNDHGDLISAKVRTDHSVGEDLLAETEREERYLLLYHDRIERHVVRTGKDNQPYLAESSTSANPFGAVPIVVFHGDRTPGDRVRGRSIIGDLAVEARTHFNVASEKRDHERSQVFAILGIPVVSMETNVSEIIAGNGSGIKIPMQSNMPLHYVAPPASVAEALDRSLEASVREMFRIARVEWETPTGTATSGIARAYQFEQTNARLRALAARWARSEQRALRMIGEACGFVGAEDLVVVPPTDFAVEDLAAELQNVGMVLDMPIGDAATSEIVKRIVRKIAPNLTPEQSAVIDAEIDEEVTQRTQDAALMRPGSLDAHPTDASLPGLTPNQQPGA